MLRSRSNQHLGINARIFYFHGLLDPSISFSNNEQIFRENVRGLNIDEVKRRFDLAVGYDSKEGFWTASIRQLPTIKETGVRTCPTA